MWYVTDDFMVALQNGYIGEIPITPTIIATAVHHLLTGKHYPQWTMFFFGDRDEELSTLFGYPPLKKAHMDTVSNIMIDPI